ncbi:hypothetical protein D5018_03505 [Parashewanella curva]|uniref:Fibronectin type-III domain-containing protein n=1 Tax=Parashewanella curva TaxID=2338552 RepID=A0A3L8Q087_9GAMM|nr:fibronectin type III domain-containing protein [Parashewanella curva]RLV61077.1 hypothetical protein D5018_03505 [Parashewanella curva]
MMPMFVGCGGGSSEPEPPKTPESIDKPSTPPVEIKLPEVVSASGVIEGNQAKLTWTLPNDDRVKNILLNRKEGAVAPDTCQQSHGDAFVRLDKSDQYTFTSLTPGKQYSFRICTSDGNKVSEGITADLTGLRVNVEDVTSLKADVEINSANLTWTTPAADRYSSLKLAYIKGNEVPATCNITSSIALAHGSKSHKLTNLEADTSYSIRLCSVGANDVSSEGQTIRFKTLPIVVVTPLAEVANATVVNNGNAANLTWDLPNDDRVKHVLINQKVGSVSPASCGQNQQDTYVKLGKDSQYTFNDLIPGQQYSYRICTSDNEVTTAGITTKLSGSRISVDNVSDVQTEVGEGFINLSWSLPTAERYLALKLAYAKGDDVPTGCSTDNSIRFDKGTNSHNLNNLEGNTNYSIRICSLGADDFSTDGVVVQATTPPIPPDQDNDGVVDAEDVDDDNDGLIEISSIAMLNNIRNNLNGTSYNDGDTNNTNGCVSSGCKGYELINNLDFSGSEFAEGGSKTNGWDPIGHDDIDAVFNGVFEGNNHTISNLYINSSESALGLFGYIRDSKIANMSLLNVNVNGFTNENDINERARYVGGLVGLVLTPNDESVKGFTRIEKVSVNGQVKSQSGAAGGLVGQINPSYYSCGQTLCDDTPRVFKPSVTIALSNTKGSVSSTNAGGLVGKMWGGTIVSSYSQSQVTGSLNPSVGLKVGRLGGLVGLLEDGIPKNINEEAPVPANLIISSFAAGEVKEGSLAGGLVGEQNAKTAIIASYAANPRVSARDIAAGMVAQWNLKPGFTDEKPVIINSYTRSSQVSGGSFRHGLVAGNSGSGIPAQVVNSHWDRNTTQDGAQRSSNGRYIIRSKGGSGYTSNQLKGNEAVTAENPGYLTQENVDGLNIPTTESPFGGWLPVQGQSYSNEQKLMLFCDDNADGVIQGSETTPIWNKGTVNEYPVINCISKDVQM